MQLITEFVYRYLDIILTDTLLLLLFNVFQIAKTFL